MIIVNEKFKLQPVVDIRYHNELLSDIIDSLEEYISENIRKTIVKGSPKNVFYISGMANKHHSKLDNYFKKNVLQKHKLSSKLISGEFAGYPSKHYWLNIDGMIVDLTISQFKDKRINTYNKLRTLLDSHCFICDNPSNIIYRLYKPDATR